MQRKPIWLKAGIPSLGASAVAMQLRSGLHTVCEEALCPNRGECWNSGTATFMLMGKVCTRNCGFCNVMSGKRGEKLDPLEGKKVAKAARKLGLRYVVLTSVDRDDLPDFGAGHIAACVEAVKEGGVKVEVLIPDFKGRKDCLRKVVQAGPDVIGHNIEVIERLQGIARDPRAGYGQSLELLHNVKRLDDEIYTKSSIMLGLGESREEVLQAMDDLRQVECDFLTLGQYLQPAIGKLEVQRFVSPKEFDELKGEGLRKGFKYVAAGPLVRSSYKAGEYFERASNL